MIRRRLDDRSNLSPVLHSVGPLSTPGMGIGKSTAKGAVVALLILIYICLPAYQEKKACCKKILRQLIYFLTSLLEYNCFTMLC